MKKPSARTLMTGITVVVAVCAYRVGKAIAAGIPTNSPLVYSGVLLDNGQPVTAKTSISAGALHHLGLVLLQRVHPGHPEHHPGCRRAIPDHAGRDLRRCGSQQPEPVRGYPGGQRVDSDDRADRGPVCGRGTGSRDRQRRRSSPVSGSAGAPTRRHQPSDGRLDQRQWPAVRPGGPQQRFDLVVVGGKGLRRGQGPLRSGRQLLGHGAPLQRPGADQGLQRGHHHPGCVQLSPPWYASGAAVETASTEQNDCEGYTSALSTLQGSGWGATGPIPSACNAPASILCCD